MKQHSSIRPYVEPVFWILVLGGLLAGIGVETDWGRRLSRPLPPPDMSPVTFQAPALSSSFALNAADTFLETGMRPLFVITRRPAPRMPETMRETMKKGQFILTGTTIVDSMKFAHLVEKAGGKARTVAEGREINGLLVQEVTATRIVLAKDNETETVPLTSAKAPPAPAKPEPAPSNKPDVPKPVAPRAQMPPLAPGAPGKPAVAPAATTPNQAVVTGISGIQHLKPKSGQ